ncbi:unnamed protein product [Phyllotreta striolata]|uniref:LIM zinc-binding domain-containing protein n=1 Tax=Phyllotreta striolata TaxID=444603 RepID=A0A9N9XQ77_PHYSR|nr:unnamed protein product [Phyllotreta striolata]
MESGGDQAPTTRTALSVSAGAAAVPVSSTPNTLSTTGGATRECAGCGKRILDRFLLKALDLFWHEDCLKCGCCDCRLGEVGSTLYTKANLILCKRDYLRLFGTTGYCAACNKVIPAFEMVMRAKNNVYHLECFACQQCNHRFCVGDRFYLCENKILCEYDYEERLVFANMAYNPSSLAHIRRQVNSLQPPAGGNPTTLNDGRLVTNSPSCYSEKNSDTAPPPHVPLRQPISLGELPMHHHQLTASHNQMLSAPHHLRGDDGSSGYGSPDSETFEPTPAHQ